MIGGFALIGWWWIVTTVIGFVGLPLTFILFKKFPGKGFGFARIVGIIIVVYPCWLAASLKIIVFGPFSLFLFFLLTGAVSWLPWKKRRAILADLNQFEKKHILRTEIVYAAALLAFGAVRMLNPDIAGTEKLPDFGFLNAIINSGWFPPLDVWFSGETINYFYFGHYICSSLITFTFTDTAFGFNLALITVFALIALESYELGFIFTGRKFGAMLALFFTTVIGNLDGLVQLAGRIVSGQPFFPINWFNWWNSSRVIVREGIDVTINEFPYWSFVLGDLHAHFMVVPISLLTLALAFRFFRGYDPAEEPFLHRYLLIICSALFLGIIPAANTWDTPTYYLIFTLSLAFGIYYKTKSFNKSFFLKLAKTLIPLLVLSYAFLLPFHMNFHPVGAQGINFVPQEKRTLLSDFLTIHGFFLFLIFSFLAPPFYRLWKTLSNEKKQISVIAAAFGIFIFIVAYGSAAPALIFAGLAMSTVLGAQKGMHRNRKFLTCLSLLAFLMLLGCETIYVDDTYGPGLERQNTVFKVYFQVWILFALVSAYAADRILAGRIFNYASAAGKNWRLVYRILFIAVFIFPVLGTNAKIGRLRLSMATLNGIAYMNRQYKDDYAAIQWLKENAENREVVLEATGEAFSHYGRISASTGQPTVLGWANHESIWRDISWQSCLKRTEDIKTIYETTDKNIAVQLMDKYDVKYVYVGNLENNRYKGPGLTKFGSFMDTVLQENGGVIYRR